MDHPHQQDNALLSAVEALLFASDTGHTLEELVDMVNSYAEATAKNTNAESTLSLQEVTHEDMKKALEELGQRLRERQAAIEIHCYGKRYQLLTKKDFHPILLHGLKQLAQKKLSRSALETLAIVAYNEPTTKRTIESIRGVQSDYAVHKLLELELLKVIGQAEELGRPNLYAVTQRFLDQFGIESLDKLPKLELEDALLAANVSPDTQEEEETEGSEAPQE
ncbi:MAG: SMC-Scp complex subunit ScpB [Bacteroidota bacterium]|nr:SMC-Scp complex subunit ScpB [Bacteroidota bacterium]MEC8032699.1 SMC-Scp complex subunit ScpB [Bacteroidota bacterium]|tara:strand:+ start:1136 stop:1801 length:666 start_codon:yes stop_codon:yes gene_type:complete